MAKVIVDKGLAGTIKAIRTQNGIAGKDLATELKKSPSYISKLEGGEIASIDSDDLIKCFRFISKESEFEDVLDTVFKTITIKFSKEEINEMLWLYNFDTVYRRIPVPDGFAKTYYDLLEEKKISYDQLAHVINQNIFIPKNILSKRNLPDNEWFEFGGNTYIKMSVRSQDLKEIIEGDTIKTNYVVLQAIVLYCIVLINYSDLEEPDENVSKTINEKTASILEEYKVYTWTQKQELIEKAFNEQEIYNKLSFHEQENINVIGQFNPLLQLYSYYDVESANRLISEFTNNMRWEAPLIMEIAGLPFYKLGQCSFRLKKELLEKIRKLLDEALNMPETEKKREQY